MTESGTTQDEMDGRDAVVAPEVGIPGRLDMRRAFDIYVFGRSRKLGPAEKGSVVGGTAELPCVDPTQEPASIPPVRAPGVPVPNELRFDRNAGTWRDGRGPSREEGPST
jgi:hypothetical protein